MHVEVKGAVDLGEVHLRDFVLSDARFVNCGLSLGTGSRSTFHSCVFRDLVGQGCSVGFPVFRDCNFVNIVAEDLINLRGCAFSDCRFSGTLENAIFGDNCKVRPLESSIVMRLQSQNREILNTGSCAIDISAAKLRNVVLSGETIAERIRFAHGQCLILRGPALAKACDDAFARTSDKSVRRFLSQDITVGQRLSVGLVPKGVSVEMVRRLLPSEIEVIDLPLA